MIIWKGLLRSLLTLIVLGLLLLSFLLTPYGFKFTFYAVGKMIPGRISYQSANGLLTGPISINQLDYQNKGTHLHINYLNFNWSPIALLFNTLKISELNANDVTLITPHTPKKTIAEHNTEKKIFLQFLTDLSKNSVNVSSNPIKLPFLLKINAAHIHHIQLGHAENKFSTTIKKIDMQGTLYPHDIDIIARIEFLKPRPILATLYTKGNLNHYTIQVSLKDTLYHMTMQAEGNKSGVVITIPSGQVLHGTVAGLIHLSWYPQINWNIKANINKMSPRLLDKNLPAAVTLSLLTQGFLKDNAIHFDLTTQGVADQAKFSIDAHHHKTWDAKWNIHLPDLHNLYAKATGAIDTQGSLKGNLILPQTTGSITAKNMSYQNIAADTIKGNWNIYLDNTQHSALDFTINQFKYRKYNLDVIHFNVSGYLLKKDMTAKLDLNQHAITMTTRGQYDGKSWTGEITQFRSQHNEWGNWTLLRPVKFSYSKEKADLQPFCLNANTGGSLCLQADWAQDKFWHISLKSKKLDFTPLQKNLLSQTQFTSQLSIQADAIGIGKEIEKATAHVDISPGVLTYMTSNQTMNTAIRSSSLNWVINKQAGLTMDANINLALKDAIHIKMSIPNFTDYAIPIKDRQLQTRIQVTLHDFRFVTLLEHVIKISLGELKGEFTLNGTVGHPKFMGDAELKVPNFEYTTMMAHVKDISAHIHADGQKLTYNLLGYAFNRAPVRLTGETNLAGPHVTTQLNVSTKNAEVIRNNQMDVFADTTLVFLLTHDALTINGNIFVLQARITPVDFSSTLEMPKSNVVYIGLPQAEQPKSSHKVNLDLKIQLGQDVNFKAYGIQAQLAGGIVLKMSPQQATIANGQVQIVSGTFQAYGQYLMLAKGSSVSFIESPISNPFLDARAFKYINTRTIGAGTQLSQNNIMVGVHIRGTLRNMKFDLYSQPAGISQADILSYLVLGYASSNTNAASFSVLMDAANAMIDSGGGLSKPVGLTDRLKQGLGIKELGVRNETVIDAIGNPIQDQSSFVVGDQISKNIYIEYSRGMVIPDNIFTVEYQLNKNWILQTTTGSGGSVGTGADILYKIETN